MQYLANKTRYIFIENMCQPILETQNKGPVEIIIGKYGSEQKVVKAVFVVASITLDNEEAYKSQGKYFANGGNKNCRICDMQTKEFYKFSTLEQIFRQFPNDYRRSDKRSIIIDQYIHKNNEIYSLRNSILEMKMAAECEIVWWKQKLFNKDNEGVGNRRLKFSIAEKELLSEMKIRNLKPMDNNIMRGVLQPFLLGNGDIDEPILQPDICFSIDKLHTAEKGFVSYSLEMGVTCFYLFQRKHPTVYGNNLGVLDSKMIQFDIYQPFTHWGSIPPRRLPGISGMHIFFDFVNIIGHIFIL
jgi:hypothetical protein